MEKAGPNRVSVKKEKFLAALKLFSCPLCGDDINSSGGSLICKNKHTYDLARKGYVNFVNNSAKSKYEKDLFTARQAVYNKGFFDPLLKHLGYSILEDLCEGEKECSRILDAGCGEGTQLAFIMKWLEKNSIGKVGGFGIDLSKEAIIQAAGKDPGVIWCVSDLAALPFRDGVFSHIVNILAPANYREFKRVLAPGGVLRKVIPGGEYLKELRVLLGYSVDSEGSEESGVKEIFLDAFPCGCSKKIKYYFSLDRYSWQCILKMTPLTWNLEQDTLNKLISAPPAGVTVDLEVLRGRKK